MTYDTALKILTQFNAWRRDNSFPPKHDMPNPKEIGQAIDVAIEVLLDRVRGLK